MSLLECRGLTRAWGAFRAVDGVDLTVEEREICAVIGPNGAGKSTLFAMIAGNLRKTSGTVRLGGEDVTALPAHALARRGVARSFQITAICPGLSALENVRLGAQAKMPWRFFGGAAAMRQGEERAMIWLDRLGLAAQAGTLAGELAHGDQRLLEVAVALAQEPRLLILDEPTQGMSVEETRRTVELLRSVMAEARTAILLVEHDLEVVFALAPRIVVLHRGRKIADGPADEVRADPAVQDAYLGGLH
ncbi:ABC transporter ATP-binding protein [Sediminicoccus rosea]|uniref:ABC transporter ATP-binding protein n=1 Tax=Sediminicoccus rosea TaxID=1225128 RepID=A0ABZ0PJS9_9PROT|nr:ABC transporter ATP-binding protein [Sediminicoccus rosea]WPB85984.1 ABC transporter ATP-binding protein [Sediminicoccus rosea]